MPRLVRSTGGRLAGRLFAQVPKVIFVDADAVVRADILELWDHDLGTALGPMLRRACANVHTRKHGGWVHSSSCRVRLFACLHRTRCVLCCDPAAFQTPCTACAFTCTNLVTKYVHV